jgi:hypothetical protein
MVLSFSTKILNSITFPYLFFSSNIRLFAFRLKRLIASTNKLHEPPIQKKSKSCSDESKPSTKRQFKTAPPILI